MKNKEIYFKREKKERKDRKEREREKKGEKEKESGGKDLKPEVSTPPILFFLGLEHLIVLQLPPKNSIESPMVGHRGHKFVSPFQLYFLTCYSTGTISPSPL